MRTFEMFRGEDESGVSGTGKVLEGVVFSDGPCIIRWVTELNGRSEARYDSFAAFVSIHITSHPTNKTKVVFSDGEVYEDKQSVKVEGFVPKTRKKRKAKVPGVDKSEGQVPPVVQPTADKPAEVSQPKGSEA